MLEGGRLVHRKGIVPGPEALLQHGAVLGRVLGRGARHDEDVLAVAHRVVERAGLGIAAVAARRLGPGLVPAVGGLDLREGDRVGAKAVERLLLAVDHLPQWDLARPRHPPGAERRAVGHRVLPALQEGLHVVGRPVAVLHGHDDGRAAEGAVAGGEDLVVIRCAWNPRSVLTRSLAIRPQTGQLIALGLLADRGDHHAAVDVVLGALDHEPAGAGRRRRARRARSARISAPGRCPFSDDLELQGVVDELDALLERALQLVAPGRDLLGACADRPP